MLLVSAKKDKEIIYYNRQNDSVYIIPFNQTPTIYFKKPYVLVVEILCLINAIIGVFSNFAVFLTFNIISAIFVVLLVCNYERRQSLELLKIIEGRADYLIRVGNRVMIKRKRFEQFLDRQEAV